MRDAPEGGKTEDGKSYDGVAPRGGEVSHGGAELERIVLGPHADAESRNGRDDAQAEVNPEGEFNADGRIGPARKSHGEKCRACRTEGGKRHIPGVDFHEVFAFDHFLHDTELCRSEYREENPVQAEESVGDPFRTRHVAYDNRDDGSEHSYRCPGYDTSLAVMTCEVACRRHHEDARCENGELEQHAAPPEGRPFERKG